MWALRVMTLETDDSVLVNWLDLVYKWELIHCKNCVDLLNIIEYGMKIKMFMYPLVPLALTTD